MELIWPTSWDKLPLEPVSPDYLIGLGYNEPRSFTEVQGHFGPDLNIHEGITHSHLGASIPVKWEKIIPLDMQVIKLHSEGQIFDSVSKCLIRGTSGYKRLISSSWNGRQGVFKKVIDKHLWSFTFPIWFDVSTIVEPDGFYILEITVDFRDNIRKCGEKLRLINSIYINNHNTWTDNLYDDPRARFSSVEWAITFDAFDSAGIKIGENNIFGYLKVDNRGYKKFDSSSNITNQITIPIQRHHGSVRAMLNPDFHANPPNFGLELLPEQDGWSSDGKKKIINIPDFNCSFLDRQVIRVTDTQSGFELGNGAALLINKIGMRDGTD